MHTARVASLLAATACVVVLCCCGAGVEPDACDSSSPRNGGGRSESENDAGAFSAGAPQRDAGIDAKAPPRDGGAPMQDAGVAFGHDAGAPTHDGGGPTQDAGVVVHPPTSTAGDAGADGPDGSTPPAYDCDMVLEVAELEPATCAFVDPASHRVGHVQWVCAGGPAHLTLGDLELDGSVHGDVLELSACRDDPQSWLSGHYETVIITADLGVKAGWLSYERDTGVACPRVFADCNATAGVVLLP